MGSIKAEAIYRLRDDFDKHKVSDNSTISTDDHQY
jgi:hypothetical protein